LLSGDKFENKVKFDFPPSPSHITKFGFRPFSVLGYAINGILCIFHKQNDAALWNPATEEIKVIHPGFAKFKLGVITCITLHGFGYDHVTHDYKVIQHVGYLIRINKYHMLNSFWEIYSLKSNS
jgi:F-box interacting protein